MISEKHLNQILHCDCVQGMRALPDACIPLTVTSPPYDDLRLYGGHPFDFEEMAKELFRVTMPGGVVVWVVQEGTQKGSETGTSSRQRLRFRELGFRLHASMIMVSNGMRYPSKVRYPCQFQYAFVLAKGKPRAVNLICDKKNTTAGAVIRKSARHKDGALTRGNFIAPIRPYGTRSNIWVYGVGSNKTTKDRFAFRHPALMPEEMAEDHILSWSQPGDLVFDPMCGAATTCKMALLNHRKYLGMEIHQPYWEIACKRIELAKEEYRRRLLAWFQGSLLLKR